MITAKIETGEVEMGSREFTMGRFFLARAEHDSDLIEYMTDLAMKQGISVAAFMAIGALKCAKLGFYDQTKHAYVEELLSEPQEIACCVGNISIKDGEPFVHAHAVLADRQGNTKAGHLLEARVSAAEVHVTELLGQKVLRKNDAVTGLSLWDI